MPAPGLGGVIPPLVCHRRSPLVPAPPHPQHQHPRPARPVSSPAHLSRPGLPPLRGLSVCHPPLFGFDQLLSALDSAVNRHDLKHSNVCLDTRSSTPRGPKQQRSILPPFWRPGGPEARSQAVGTLLPPKPREDPPPSWFRGRRHLGSPGTSATAVSASSPRGLRRGPSPPLLRTPFLKWGHPSPATLQSM